MPLKMMGRIVKRFVRTRAVDRLSKRQPMKKPIDVPHPVPRTRTSMKKKNLSAVWVRPVEK